MVKLVQGLYYGSPRVVELEIGLHHGCPDSDHRNPGVVKLVMELHHRSPRMVKLEVGLHQRCTLGGMRYPGVVKLVNPKDARR